MDIQAIKRGIVLSKNQPFVKKTTKIPTQVNQHSISFNISAQLTPQQTYQTSKPQRIPLNSAHNNNQPIYSHSQTSINPNHSKNPTIKNAYHNIHHNNTNNNYNNHNKYNDNDGHIDDMNKNISIPFQSLKHIDEAEHQKLFNCSQTVFSTQDSFIINKDYQDTKSIDKSIDHYNSITFLNDQSQSRIIHDQSQSRIVNDQSQSRILNDQSQMRTINDNINSHLYEQINNLKLNLDDQRQKNNKLLRQIHVQICRNDEKTHKINTLQSTIKTILSQHQQLHNKNNNILLCQSQISTLKANLTTNYQKIQKQQKQIQILQCQLSQKTSYYQSQIIKYKGNKNRLQLDAQNNKRLIKYQRQKYEKQRSQINKLIFFQQDLIHAKDYQKIKQQNTFLLNQTQKMYNEHKLYVQQSRQHRQNLQLQIVKLNIQIKNMNKSISNDRTKLNNFIENNNKLDLIKIQNQSNFNKRLYQEMKNKNQDIMVILKNRQQQIADLRLIIHQTKKTSENKHTNIVQQMNIKNIQHTISVYESRLQDTSILLKQKEAQLQKNKRIIDYLTTQLRKNRQMSSIQKLKQLNQQNNLKDDLISLKRSHEVEINILKKKIQNLDDCITRKGKEIGQKDKFINRIIQEKGKIQKQYKIICQTKKRSVSQSQKYIKNRDYKDKNNDKIKDKDNNDHIKDTNKEIHKETTHRLNICQKRVPSDCVHKQNMMMKCQQHKIDQITQTNQSQQHFCLKQQEAQSNI